MPTTIQKLPYFKDSPDVSIKCDDHTEMEASENSVADRELKNAHEIIEDLKEYLDKVIRGYTGPTETYYEAVQSWMERHHGFPPLKERFVEVAGIVPGIGLRLLQNLARVH